MLKRALKMNHDQKSVCCLHLRTKKYERILFFPLRCVLIELICDSTFPFQFQNRAFLIFTLFYFGLFQHMNHKLCFQSRFAASRLQTRQSFFASSVKMADCKCFQRKMSIFSIQISNFVNVFKLEIDVKLPNCKIDLYF